MPDSLTALEPLKAALLRQMQQLDDFRPGSITTTTGRCGLPAATAISPKTRVTDPTSVSPTRRTARP